MTLYTGVKDPTLTDPQSVITQSRGGLIENFNAAFHQVRAMENTFSMENMIGDQWGPVIDTINERMEMNLINPISVREVDSFVYDLTNGSVNPYSSYINSIVNIIQQNPDTLNDLQWVTQEEIESRARNQALEYNQQFNEIATRTPGFQGGLARFAGGMAGAATDPINIASMIIPFGQGTKLSTLLFREFMVNAGVEAMIQPEVAQWYNELGLEYTAEQFWTNVAAAGTVGAALPAAFRGLNATYNLTKQQTQRGIEALRNTGLIQRNRNTNTLETTIDILEDEANALRNTNDADFTESQSRLNEATRALSQAEAPRMPDISESNTGSRNLFEMDNADPLLTRLDPANIQVDAETFQFKAGGDEFGVSKRLQGITKWDPIKSGTVTVFEYADGRQFIADGHQRLGLAKRLSAQDPTQDIALYGFILREKDGITPEMARVIAAVKNISEGTGTAIDAAKILRMDPTQIGELPPSSALVQQAQGLVLLSDEAFSSIVNGVLNPKYGSIVGKLIEDPGLQLNAIQILNKTDPSNAFQAESIVRQIRETGGEKITQESLFGEELFVESYFIERAKILDNTIKALRRDKAAFNTLVKNASKMEDAGNVLARNENIRRAENDEKAIAIIQALANKAGPLSDALTAAARTARDTGSYRQSTEGFLDAVRRSIESGDIDRVTSGDVGQPINVAQKGDTFEDVAESQVDAFEEVGGKGFVEQGDQLENDLLSIPDLDETLEIPIEEIIDPETGATVVQSQSVRDIRNEIEQDQAMLDRLRGCVE
jgi:hypothetical protein